MTSWRAHGEVGLEVAARAQRRQSRVSPLRRAGAALKAANGAHGAELAELSGLLHAGLVKREPEDLSRKVVDEPEPHALKPPRHKVRHTSARRRRARTHSHTYLPVTHVLFITVFVRCNEHRARDALAAPARALVQPACAAHLVHADYEGPFIFFGITFTDKRERDTIERH